MDHAKIVRCSNKLLLDIQSDTVFRDQINGGVMGPALRQRYHKVLQSYPGVLFEEAFLNGDTTLWREAVRLDPHIKIEPERFVHLFNGFASGYKVCYRSSEEVLAWKQWRDASLRWDEYTHDTFPAFPVVRQRRNMLYTNFPLPPRVLLDDIVYETNRGEIMPGSSAYMFEYELASFR